MPTRGHLGPNLDFQVNCNISFVLYYKIFRQDLCRFNDTTALVIRPAQPQDLILLQFLLLLSSSFFFFLILPARDIFFRITAQDRNIMLLAQFNSCVINIHFVTVYDAIISLLWFTIHVISIYSVKAYQGLLSRHWQLTPRCVNG